MHTTISNRKIAFAAAVVALTACSNGPRTPADSGTGLSGTDGSSSATATSPGAGSDSDAETSGGQDPGCADLDCGANGSCQEGAQGATCTCDTGFSGATCEACAPGYTPSEDGCVETDGLGAGPPCPEPPQAPIDDAWPEAFVGLEGCDDSGPGTRALPYCSLQLAIDAYDAPAVVTMLEGTYRLNEMTGNDGSNARVVKPGSADAYFTVRADPGRTVTVLGSSQIVRDVWEDAGNGLMRTQAGFSRDPTGLWQEDGERMIHVMEMRNGIRSHADTTDVVDAGTWTKASADGTGCGGSNNNCFIYLRPPAGTDPNTIQYEASQQKLLTAIGSSYLVIEGFTTRFTQNAGAFVEGSNFVLIQDNDFGHNANGNDNAYSVFVQYAEGTYMRRNKAFDSRYWGGSPNSRGLTMMSGGAQADLWVCNNEIWDIIGTGITTKSGVSNVHAVANYVHEVGMAVEIPDQRCHWKGCDVELYPGGNWTVRENVFENCGRGIDMRTSSPEGEYAGNRIYNNLFIDTSNGIVIDLGNRPEYVRNNAFIGGPGILFSHAAEGDIWPDTFLEQGLDSDFNLFFGDVAFMQHPNWSGAAYYPLTFDEYRDQYTGETNSLGADPLLDPATWLPAADSPLLGVGDPSVYEGAAEVNIGHRPFYTP